MDQQSVVVYLVRVLGSHPRDPGSSPGNGTFAKVEKQLLSHE